MNRDERICQKPDTFYPERFLPDPEGYGEKHRVTGFGFGRRVCPGRHLGDAAVWIAMASILAVLNIMNAIGEDGHKVVPEVAFTDSLVSHPEPFDCAVVPRSAKAQSLFAESQSPEMDVRQACISGRIPAILSILSRLDNGVIQSYD